MTKNVFKKHVISFRENFFVTAKKNSFITREQLWMVKRKSDEKQIIHKRINFCHISY